ncbi:hypothetical protein Tco_0755317 [Tanacetum coccineum]
MRRLLHKETERAWNIKEEIYSNSYKSFQVIKGTYWDLGYATPSLSQTIVQRRVMIALYQLLSRYKNLYKYDIEDLKYLFDYEWLGIYLQNSQEEKRGDETCETPENFSVQEVSSSV